MSAIPFELYSRELVARCFSLVVSYVHRRESGTLFEYSRQYNDRTFSYIRILKLGNFSGAHEEFSDALASTAYTHHRIKINNLYREDTSLIA